MALTKGELTRELSPAPGERQDEADLKDRGMGGRTGRWTARIEERVRGWAGREVR